MLDVEVSWGTFEGGHVHELIGISLQGIIDAVDTRGQGTENEGCASGQGDIARTAMIVCVDGGSVRTLERGTASYCVAFILCRLSRS